MADTARVIAVLEEWEEAHDEMLRSKWAEEDTPTRANKMADAMHTNDASYLYKY